MGFRNARQPRRRRPCSPAGVARGGKCQSRHVELLRHGNRRRHAPGLERPGGLRDSSLMNRRDRPRSWPSRRGRGASASARPAVSLGSPAIPSPARPPRSATGRGAGPSARVNVRAAVEEVVASQKDAAARQPLKLCGVVELAATRAFQRLQGGGAGTGRSGHERGCPGCRPRVRAVGETPVGAAPTYGDHSWNPSAAAQY